MQAAGSQFPWPDTLPRPLWECCLAADGHVTGVDLSSFPAQSITHWRRLSASSPSVRPVAPAFDVQAYLHAPVGFAGHPVRRANPRPWVGVLEMEHRECSRNRPAAYTSPWPPCLPSGRAATEGSNAAGWTPGQARSDRPACRSLEHCGAPLNNVLAIALRGTLKSRLLSGVDSPFPRRAVRTVSRCSGTPWRQMGGSSSPPRPQRGRPARPRSRR